jgi:simple sugar transport system permease protein
MMNYIALYFNSWVVRTFLPVDQKTLARTIQFPASASFTPLNFGTSSKFHFGFLVVIVCLLLYWFIIEKTSFGFSLRATGFNKEGARYAGMSTNMNTILSMMIAGAFTGIAGAIVTLGVYSYGRIFTAFDNYGFDGISVALIGACKTSGIIFGGLLIGLLKAAGTTLQLLGISKEIAQLIQACILIFIAIQYGIVLVLNKLEAKRKMEAPKS